jgi:hypothetical protein
MPILLKKKLIKYALTHDDCTVDILFYIACYTTYSDGCLAIQMINDDDILYKVAHRSNDARKSLLAAKKMKDSEQAKDAYRHIMQELAQDIHEPFFDETKKEFDAFFNHEGPLKRY